MSHVLKLSPHTVIHRENSSNILNIIPKHHLLQSSWYNLIADLAHLMCAPLCLFCCVFCLLWVAFALFCFKALWHLHFVIFKWLIMKSKNVCLKSFSISCLAFLESPFLPFNAPCLFFVFISLSLYLPSSFPLSPSPASPKVCGLVKHIYIKNLSLFLLPVLHLPFLVYWPLTNFFPM